MFNKAVYSPMQGQCTMSPYEFKINNYHIARFCQGQYCFCGFHSYLKNLIIVYKCNDSLVDPQNLIHEIYH